MKWDEMIDGHFNGIDKEIEFLNSSFNIFQDLTLMNENC